MFKKLDPGPIFMLLLIAFLLYWFFPTNMEHRLRPQLPAAAGETQQQPAGSPASQP